MVRRLGVYRTFITGILVGLFYVVIVSEKASNLFIFSGQGFIDQRILVLICSGILGGVLYPVIVDGSVELPRFSKDGYSFKAGLLGDILLGISGAFILEFLTSSMQATPDTSYVIYAAKGIIGGYGSEALMNVALNKFLSRFEEIKAEKEAAQAEVTQLQQQMLEGQQLLDQLNTHIERGLSQEDLKGLTYGIQQAPKAGQIQIFKITKEFRSLSSRTEEFKERTKRTIPIFEALVHCEPDNHAYHAQLAFAYKDIPQPNYYAAINQLDQAIQLREQWERSPTWKYELNRAIAHILLNLAERGRYQTPDDVTKIIVRDLLAVIDARPLDQILRDAEQQHLPSPLLEWANNNRQSLPETPQTRPLLKQLEEALGHKHSEGEPAGKESDARTLDSATPEGLPSNGSVEPVALETAPHSATPHSATSSSGSNGEMTADAVIPSVINNETENGVSDSSESANPNDQAAPISLDNQAASLNDMPEAIPDSNGESNSMGDGTKDGRSPAEQLESSDSPTPPPSEAHQGTQADNHRHSNRPVHRIEAPPHDTRSIEARELESIRKTLQQDVTGVLHIRDWNPDLFRAVKQGLIHLGFIDSDASVEEFQQAWAQFKASVGRGGEHLIGNDSANLFLKSLERIAQPNQAADARPLTALLKPETDEGVEVEGSNSGGEGLTGDRPLAALESNSITEMALGWSVWDEVLLDVPTHGASDITAKQDGLTFNGLLASNQMARHDLSRVEKLRNRFRRAAAKYDVPAPLLAAIASRESRCGKLLDENGLGDHGNAFGIMQIDKRHHTPAGLGGDPASQAHIDQAAKVLADNIKAVKAKHSDWEDEFVLKGAVAAYNFGVKNVQTQGGLDRGTTGDDYGADVIARAKFYITLFNL